MPPGNLGRQSRFRAAPELLRLFAEKDIALTLAPRERILLRDSDGRPLPYEDTEQIRRMRRRLEMFNEAAAAQTVSLGDRIIREGEPIITPKNSIGASTLTMSRVFNRDFRLGGRFYGPWAQSVEPELRSTIQINGNPTEEPDFPEHHVRLLYDVADAAVPAEPFILDGWDRKTVKDAFYTLLNAETPLAARRSIAYDLMRGSFSEADKLIVEIEKKHPFIVSWFGSGAGLWLMRKDSEITEAILSKLIRGGDFAIPVHDSYIVPHKIGQRTREVMQEVLEKSTRKTVTVNTTVSRTKAIDITEIKQSDLHNGPGAVPLPPAWVWSLSSDLATLAAVAWFYGSIPELGVAA